LKKLTGKQIRAWSARPIGSIAPLATGGFRAQIVEHGADAFRSAPANAVAGGAPLRRVDDATTVIADPVGQCVLTTAAEDTVQFVAAVTDQRVAHLVRGNEARKIFDPRIGAWPLTGSLAGRDNYRCGEPRLMAACNQGTGRQTGRRCPSEAAGCHAAPKSQTKPGKIISVMIASLIRLCSVPVLS